MRVRLLIVGVVALAVIMSGCGDDDPAADDTTTEGSATEDRATEDRATEDRATADDADAPADGSDDATVDDGEAGEESEESSADDSAGPAGAAGTGTMTVGELTYELEVIRCVTLAGAIAADAVAVDEPDNVSVSISLSPEDWQARPASEGWTANGSLRLDVDEPYQQWEAGVEALEGFNLPGPATLEDFAITSYDVSDDGQSASGEASFASIDALLRGETLEPTPGRFAITCPDS